MAETSGSSTVAEIIADAGGKIIGKTRLQKVAYLMKIAGFGLGYKFAYHYFGPFSKDLENDTDTAWAFDQIERVDHRSSWGGKYSVFSVNKISSKKGARQKFAHLAANTDAVVLELAATAVFLKLDGFDDPWAEVVNRKSDKATDKRISAAKAAYADLSAIKTPIELPSII